MALPNSVKAHAEAVENASEARMKRVKTRLLRQDLNFGLVIIFMQRYCAPKSTKTILSSFIPQDQRHQRQVLENGRKEPLTFYHI